MTPNELIERAAQAVFKKRVRGISFEKSLSGRATKEDARSVIRIALEEAIRACERQARDFASDEYATSQPVGSISERFACAQCVDAIRALLPQEDGE